MNRDNNDKSLQPLKLDQVREHLAKKYKFKPDKVESMIAILITSLEGAMTAIQKALASEDMIALGKIMHTLKGIMLNIGLDELAEFVTQFEQEAKIGNIMKCKDFYEQLKRSVSPIVSI